MLAIETATELGVYGVLPWSADRSIVRWKGERASKAHTKWQNTVTAAAKQSRRALIPEVYDLYSTADLVGLIGKLLALSSPPPCSSCMSGRPNASAPWH